MSRQAVDQSQVLRRRCQVCRDRKARFRFRGAVRADRDHTLCFECFRSQRDRNRAAALAGNADPAPVPAPLPSRFPPARALTTADVEHRQRMLAHLHRLSCQARG